MLRPADMEQSSAMALLWAVASVAITGALAWALDKFGLLGSPYPILLLAVFMSCYFAGARAGVLAALLGGAGGQLLAVLTGFHATDLNDVTLFALASLATIGLTALAIERERAARTAREREQAAESSAAVTSRELDLLIGSATEYAICLIDPEGRLVIWNSGAERLFGWPEAEVVCRTQEILFAPEERATGESEKELTIARREGRFAGRRRRARKDGTAFLADVVLTRIDGPDGALLGFGKVVRDVTQEQADADAIEAREVHLRTILATVPDAMIVIDETGIVQSFSRAAEALFGYREDEVIGRNVSMLMTSPDREAHDDYLARYRSNGQKRVIGRKRRVFGRRKDGSTFPHELTVAEAIGGGQRLFTGFIRDLTASEAAEARLQELQAELFHISRLSAVGTMAATLAHELNQPLTAVANYVQSSAMLLENIPQASESSLREALTEAGKEALRAGAIVRRLREFLARGELDWTIEPIGALVENAVALGKVGSHLRNIQIESRVGDTVGAAMVDRVQVQQVLVNLIRNAIEAIADGTEGIVRVTVEPQGGMLLFTVSDNGHGVTVDICESLFDPFVSTKERGMGLGLSICRTIVEAHGGRIWCEPLPEGGAAFHFTVPAIGQETSDV